MSTLRYYVRDFFRGPNAETAFGFLASSAAAGALPILLIFLVFL